MLRSRLQLVRFIALALLLTLAVAPSAVAKPHPHQAQGWKQQIENLEEQWRVAMLHGDIPMMASLLSDDYVGISMTGEISTKTMQLDRLKTSKLSLTKLDLSDVKVKLLGRVAIVTSLADVAGSNDGVPIAGRFRYTRVYQRVGPGVWKITNFEITRLSPRHQKHSNDADESAEQRSPS